MKSLHKRRDLKSDFRNKKLTNKASTSLSLCEFLSLSDYKSLKV